MHLFRLATAVASLASAAVTTASPSLLPFQDGGALDRRALTPDDIKCHKSCGNTIQGASKEGYCDDVAWKQLEKRCSECAPKQNNIAAKYHDALKKALEPCGLEAPPVSASAATSSAAAQSTSVVSVQPTSAGQESSVAKAGPTSTGLGSLVSSATGAAASTTSASASGGSRANASTTASPSSASNDAQGSHAVAFGPLAATLAVLFAAAML